MHIVNHRLVGPNVTFRVAQSCGGRFKKRVQAICAHDTAGSMKKLSSVKWFESPKCTTSAHVVIELDGTVTQMVPFDTIAHHAGRSFWKDDDNCNDRMIGIEICNPGMMVRRGDEVLLIYKEPQKGKDGKVRIVEKIVERFPVAKCREVNTKEHGRGWALPYTDAQIKAFTEVCRALAEAYDSIDEIVTHWMISPGRKVDTTPAFPLAQIREAVFHPEKLDAIPAPPEPQAVAPPAQVAAPVGYVKAGMGSTTVWAAIAAILWKIVLLFQDTFNHGLEWIMWAIGLLPDVTNEVQGVLTNGQLVASWFKLSWPKLALPATIICLVVVIIRHTRDKKQLAHTKAQLEAQQQAQQ